jgi:hypothetical protein
LGTEIFFGKSEIRLDNKQPDGQISWRALQPAARKIPGFLIVLQGGDIAFL